MYNLKYGIFHFYPLLTWRDHSSTSPKNLPTFPYIFSKILHCTAKEDYLIINNHFILKAEKVLHLYCTLICNSIQMSVAYPARMGTEVIRIQNGGGMLTSSVRRAHSVRTKVGRLRKHSVLKSDSFSVILTIKREY